MRQVVDLDLALPAQTQQFGRLRRAERQVEYRRSSDLGVDQGFALGHGAGETIPSLANVGIDIARAGRRRKRLALLRVQRRHGE